MSLIDIDKLIRKHNMSNDISLWSDEKRYCAASVMVIRIRFNPDWLSIKHYEGRQGKPQAKAACVVHNKITRSFMEEYFCFIFLLCTERLILIFLLYDKYIEKISKKILNKYMTYSYSRSYLQSERYIDARQFCWNFPTSWNCRESCEIFESTVTRRFAPTPTR